MNKSAPVYYCSNHKLFEGYKLRHISPSSNNFIFVVQHFNKIPSLLCRSAFIKPVLICQNIFHFEAFTELILNALYLWLTPTRTFELTACKVKRENTVREMHVRLPRYRIQCWFAWCPSSSQHHPDCKLHLSNRATNTKQVALPQTCARTHTRAEKHNEVNALKHNQQFRLSPGTYLRVYSQ